MRIRGILEMYFCTYFFEHFITLLRMDGVLAPTPDTCFAKLSPVKLDNTVLHYYHKLDPKYKWDEN